jgi:hypothetical protein
LTAKTARTRIGLRPVRVTVSGTIVIPYDYDVDNPDINEHRRGQERLKYTLTVRRVR